MLFRVRGLGWVYLAYTVEGVGFLSLGLFLSLGVEWREACSSKLSAAADNFATQHIVEPLLQAIRTPGRITLDQLAQYYLDKGHSSGFTLQAKSSDVPLPAGWRAGDQAGAGLRATLGPKPHVTATGRSSTNCKLGRPICHWSPWSGPSSYK